MARRIIPDVVKGQKLLELAPTVTVRDAARQMADRRVGAALVVDGDQLVGIFTERDMMVRIVARGRDPDRTAVGEVMTSDPRTITPESSAVDALRLMHENGYRHLPVADLEGGIVGIVSIRDFAGAEFGQIEAEERYKESLMESLSRGR